MAALVGVQHVLAMSVGVISVPLLVAQALKLPVELVLAQFLPRLRMIFTPLVSGTVVLLIGLSLIPVGLKSIGAGLGPALPSWSGLAGAAFVVGLVLLLNAVRYQWARLAAIPLAPIAGYVLCLLIGAVPSNSGLASSQWFEWPVPLKYGLNVRPEFLLAFLLPYVITTLETIGDVTATSQLSDDWVAAILCLLGLLPAVGRWIAILPGPVLGSGYFSALWLRCYGRNPNPAADCSRTPGIVNPGIRVG